MGALRFILALAVVVTHSGPVFGLRFPHGFIAVQAFFIISGFYMALILNEKYTGAGSYRTFISNRMLRLFPVYWLMLLVTLVLSPWMYEKFIDGQWGLLSGYVLLWEEMSFQQVAILAFANLFMVVQDWLMFFDMNMISGWFYFLGNRQAALPLWNMMLIPQAWTLGVEITFYLMAPFLVRRSVPVLAAATALSLLLRGYLHFGLGLTSDAWQYQFFPTALGMFLAGALAYKGYAWLRERDIPARTHLIVGLAPVAIAVLYQFIPGAGVRDWAFYALLACCLPSLFIASHKNHLDRMVGELSYPLYICHFTVIYAVVPLFNKWRFDAGFRYEGVWMSVLSVLLSMALLKWVVMPVEKIRQQRASRQMHRSVEAFERELK